MNGILMLRIPSRNWPSTGVLRGLYVLTAEAAAFLASGYCLGGETGFFIMIGLPTWVQ